MFFNALARRIVAVVTLLAIFMVILFGMPFANGHIARAAGNTWIVTSTADGLSSNCSAITFTGTNCELRDAISQAAAGDTITFSATGTITLGSSGTLTLNKNVTLTGPGAASLAIDGNNAVTVFTIISGVTASITGLTIQHGYAPSNGGGINNLGTLTINNSIISSNSAPNNGSGGGIYNRGTVTLNNSTVSGNSAVCGGAGLENSGVFGSNPIYPIIIITDSIVSNNMASGVGYCAGSIENYGGTLTVKNSTLSGNMGYLGGAVEASGRTTTTIVGSTLTNNSANAGGAIYNLGNLTIDHDTLSNNSAQKGGAILNVAPIIISDSTLSGNTAVNAGGAIYGYNDSTITLSNSTLSNNSANTGGAIYMDNVAASNTLNLLSSIVAGNTLTGTGGSGTDIKYVSGVINSFGHNLVGDGTGLPGLTNGVNNDQVGTSVTPINPLLGTLANNGGSTQTMALNSGSPAIGAGDCNGNSSAIPPAPQVGDDQRGITRDVPCDIGAYEGSVNPTSTPTATNTFIPTSTATNTNTATLTLTPTATSTATSTNTATITATPTATTSPTSTPTQAKIDTVGVYRSGTFYLKLHNSTGYADITISFTVGTKPYPIVGDWTGSGFDTVGVYDQSNGKFSLRNTNAPGLPDEQFVLGNPNDQPLSGPWLISATNAGVGVFRPSNGLIYLKNALTTGYADYTMVLGIPGDTGLAGDWNGKGFDSPGVYRPSNSYFYLSNQVKNGSVIGDYQLQYGIGGDSPVAGDWIAQGHDGVGLFRQSNGFTYLKNTLVTGYADNAFTYGIAGDVPVAGHWQLTYPPVVQKPSPQAPAPSVLIAKTASPQLPNSSVEGSNQIGG